MLLSVGQREGLCHCLGRSLLVGVATRRRGVAIESRNNYKNPNQ